MTRGPELENQNNTDRCVLDLKPCENLILGLTQLQKLAHKGGLPNTKKGGHNPFPQPMWNLTTIIIILRLNRPASTRIYLHGTFL